MIDALGTVSMNTTVLARNGSRGGDARPGVAEVNSVQAVPYVSGSRIRVDNLLNLAILEWRSDAGDVVQQVPTEGQIRAFERADSSGGIPAPSAEQAATPVETPKADPAPQSEQAAPAASSQAQPQTPIATASVVV